MIEYNGIDYDYRPERIAELDQNSALYVVARIKGSNRQEMVIDYIKRDAADELEPGLLRESLPREEVDALARFDASFLGGEFLPDFANGEVELVRLVLQTAHRDTISVRARPAEEGHGMVELRVVDEYGTDFETAGTRLSARPSLRELLEWLERQPSDIGGLLMLPIERALDSGASPADLRGFVEVRSLFYPGIAPHAHSMYEERIRENGISVAASGYSEEEGPLADFAADVRNRGEKRGKLRTLLGLFGYERRSEANVREISKALYTEGIAIVPSLLKTEDGWPIELDDWFKAYPLWLSAEMREEAVMALEHVRSRALPKDIDDFTGALLRWADQESENAEPLVCLFLLLDAMGDEQHALEAARDAVRADDERAAPWLCLGRHLMRYEVSDYEALSSFYKAIEFPATLFERYHALSWIHKVQVDADARRYARQAQGKIEQLETAGIRPLPGSDAPLVDVLYPAEFELVGL